MESAGIIVYRKTNHEPEFLLVCPGGPFYKDREVAVWTIPKGLINRGESPIAAAIREFQEETGFAVTQEPSFLMQLKLNKKKLLHAFFIEGDYDVSKLQSNTFELEYPKSSGQTQHFPEIAVGRWMQYDEAMRYIHPKQQQLLVVLYRNILCC